MLYINGITIFEVNMQDCFIFNNGNPYIRVSTIIAHLAGGFDDIPAEILANKAKIGTEVHKMCQNYILGDQEVFSDNPRSQNYFNCFKNFCDEGILCKPLLCEERFFDDELGITGQIDLICPIEGKKQPALIDLKTSAKKSPSFWTIQGCLYAHMIEKTRPDLDISDTVIFMQLKERGSPDFFKFNWRNAIDDVINLVTKFLEINKTILSSLLEEQIKKDVETNKK